MTRRGPNRARRLAPAIALVAAAQLIAAPADRAPSVGATFQTSAVVAASFTTDTLGPPTSLASTATIGLTVTLLWTATPDLYAKGYRVYRRPTLGSTYALVATVTPRTTTTTSNTPLVPGSYTYVVRAYAGPWTSADSNAVTVILL